MRHKYRPFHFFTFKSFFTNLKSPMYSKLAVTMTVLHRPFTFIGLLSAMNSLKEGERHMFFMSGHFSIADCLISKIKNVCHGFTPAKSDQFSLGFFYQRRARRIQSLESVRTMQNQKGFPIHTSFDLLIWKQNSGFLRLPH